MSKVTPAGVVSTFASGFNDPVGLAFDAGNLYVDNDGDNTMSKFTETLTVPFALGGTAASGVAYGGVTAGLLSFGIGQTTQDITGKLLADPGPTQTLTFTLGTPAGGAVLGSPSVNTLTITNRADAHSNADTHSRNANADLHAGARDHRRATALSPQDEQERQAGGQTRAPRLYPGIQPSDGHERRRFP